MRLGGVRQVGRLKDGDEHYRPADTSEEENGSKKRQQERRDKETEMHESTWQTASGSMAKSTSDAHKGREVSGLEDINIIGNHPK